MPPPAATDPVLSASCSFVAAGAAFVDERERLAATALWGTIDDDVSKRGFEMSPLRAFFLSFALGLAVLFSGHGLVDLMVGDPPSNRITV